MKYVYIAIELMENQPKIVGVYSTEEKAQDAYKNANGWINIIKKEVQ